MLSLAHHLSASHHARERQKNENPGLHVSSARYLPRYAARARYRPRTTLWPRVESSSKRLRLARNRPWNRRNSLQKGRPLMRPKYPICPHVGWGFDLFDLGKHPKLKRITPTSIGEENLYFLFEVERGVPLRGWCKVGWR